MGRDRPSVAVLPITADTCKSTKCSTCTAEQWKFVTCYCMILNLLEIEFKLSSVQQQLKDSSWIISSCGHHLSDRTASLMHIKHYKCENKSQSYIYYTCDTTLELITPENTITYLNTLCLSPQILHKHCFPVSLGAILTLKRNWRQCLCKILKRQTKSIMVCYDISGVVNTLCQCKAAFLKTLSSALNFNNILVFGRDNPRYSKLMTLHYP